MCFTGSHTSERQHEVILPTSLPATPAPVTCYLYGFGRWLSLPTSWQMGKWSLLFFVLQVVEELMLKNL